MKYSELIAGDTLYYKNMPGALSWIQRVVMDMEYSHCSLAVGRLRVIPHLYPLLPLEFEADIKVRLHSFKRDDEIDPAHREVYRLRNVPDWIINEAILELIEEFDGEVYAFLQWLSIFIRRCGEWGGFDKAQSWKIFWRWTLTVVCSELLYYFVEKIANKMINFLNDSVHLSKSDKELLATWRAVLIKLGTFNPDTFTPKDLGLIQNSFNLAWMRIL
jgi:hypothetical protein